MRFGTFSYTQARPGVPERQAYDELLAQIEFTDKLGFHEAWFAEHHHSDYGMLASPNLVTAARARRTERLRFGNLVSVLPYLCLLYDCPDYSTLFPVQFLANLHDRLNGTNPQTYVPDAFGLFGRDSLVFCEYHPYVYRMFLWTTPSASHTQVSLQSLQSFAT